MVSEVGDLSGTHALREIHRRMQQDEEGALILKERPRMRAKWIEEHNLENLPSNTFGHVYHKFMSGHGFTAEE